jgi:DNA-3-methyladenine glycosylase I
VIRCGWSGSDPLYVAYHDREWGVPVHDDRLLFEFLVLEGAQAGLSWLTILKKRENYRRAFDHFELETVAAYDEHKVAALLADAGIVRNRLKVNAAIRNAQVCLALREEFGSLDAYLWRFAGGQDASSVLHCRAEDLKPSAGGKPRQNQWRSLGEIPSKTAESDALSKDLLKRGCKFVGSTICYAFMQAAGLVNDHTVECFRYNEVAGL